VRKEPRAQVWRPFRPSMLVVARGFILVKDGVLRSGCVGVLDRQTYQGGTRGSRLCGEDCDRETENSMVCTRTRDTRFIQVRAAKVANPTPCSGIKYGALRLVFVCSDAQLGTRPSFI
jgi:hypothetical protein